MRINQELRELLNLNGMNKNICTFTLVRCIYVVKWGCQKSKNLKDLGQKSKNTPFLNFLSFLFLFSKIRKCIRIIDTKGSK